jgi:hypothetical protein
LLRRRITAEHGQGKIVSEEELRAIVEEYDLDGSGTFDEVVAPQWEQTRVSSRQL